MATKQNGLGWIFEVDGYAGIPYVRCPYCGRRVGGKDMIFAYEALDTCPDCDKPLHFENVSDDDWMYVDTYYGREV